MGLFSSSGDELRVSPEVRSDPNAYECARVWMREGAPVIFVERIRETEDPRAWGSVLADVAAFVSSKYRDESGRPVPEALAEIQKMFNHLVGQWVKQRGGSTGA